MRDELNTDKNVVSIVPRSWRAATQTVLDAAARLQAVNAPQGKPAGIKPSVPVRSELSRLKGIDFGVARFVEGDAVAESIAGAGICSPAFMSPERCRGQHADARSDLYALTCRYYELLTGEAAFSAADVATLQYEHCYTPFPDAAAKAPGLPDAVRRVLARGSEKEPAQRYQSIAELVADLNTLLATSGTPGAAKRLYADMPAGTAPLWAGKKSSSVARKVVILLVVLAVAAIIALFVFRDRWNPEFPPPAEPVKPVARSPRYVSPFIPATTRSAASVVPAPSIPALLPASKVTAVPQRDVAAYLRGLGIVDKPKVERGETLRALDFTRPIPPNEWSTLVPLMNDVGCILFHNQSGTDEAVSYVAKLPMLRRLSLDGEPVTDKACAFLKGTSSLDRLDLPHTAISGQAIADIAAIPNLTALDLRKTAVRGACWKPLLRSRVSTLWIEDNPISDRDLADLAGDPSIMMMQLSNTLVTNAVIDTLATMPGFRQGDFAETSIDDTGVEKLSRLQNLVTLELSGCLIGENGLVPLAKLTKLRRLVIRDLALSDPALNALAQCSQLEGLDLSRCRFNASGLGELSRLSMLRWLRIGGATIVSAGGAATSQQMLDNLKRKLPNLVIDGTPQETPPK